MSSWVCSGLTRNVLISNYPHLSSLSTQQFGFATTTRRTFWPTFRVLKLRKFRSFSQSPMTREDEEDSESFVQALKIPDDWLLPSKAIEESEWLRVTLHKWLDDEYCPEPTNVEISNVAAKSYYGSLLEKETDVGVILLKMAQDLTSISYQESFHGAFTSANAAINLIVERVDSGLY